MILKLDFRKFEIFEKTFQQILQLLRYYIHMHVANLPSRKDTKLCGFFSYNSTKQMLDNPTYCLRRKQTFHVRILVLTRLDGQLITLLSQFPALRGSLYLYIDTRVTPVTFFRYRQSSRSPKTQTNSALF